MAVSGEEEILASFICFFQILENWKLSKFIFQFLEKYFSNFRIFGKMIFQKLENKLETFQFSKFWKMQMNDPIILKNAMSKIGCHLFMLNFLLRAFKRVSYDIWRGVLALCAHALWPSKGLE